MAYSTDTPPILLCGSIKGGQLWHYASADVHTDVDAANYFTNGQALGMRAGDVVMVIETDNSYALTLHSVTEVSSDGATVSAGIVAA